MTLVSESRKHSIYLLYDFEISLDGGVGDFVYIKVGEVCGFSAFRPGLESRTLPFSLISVL